MTTSSSDAPEIVVENASKVFLDGAVLAFHQLNLAVRAQEILCVVGPSGCGKTTFLRCIAGLTDLSSGTLKVDGAPVVGPPPGVAMVFQHFGLLPWKTVYENAAFGLAMAGTPSAVIKERVAHYLDLVGLAGFERHYPYQLSGGMQQRVGLVRALAINPTILLIDEAILLGDRVAIMTARPGRTKEIIDMPFGRPRDVEAVRADPHFPELRAHIWRQLHTAQTRRPRPGSKPAKEVA